MRPGPVLHVTTGRAWRGGERQVLGLLRGLSARGVRQALVCTRGGAMEARARAEGFEVHALPIVNEVDLVTVGRVAALLRRGRHAILHLHTSQAHGLGAMAARLLGARRPRIVVTRRVDYSIYRHGFLGLDRLKYAPGADLVLCVSERVRDVLRADGVPADRLRVVRSGLDLRRTEGAGAARDAVRREWGVPADAPLVGSVGQLVGHKAHCDLVAALPAVRATFPDLRAVIVGEGEERGALEEQARRLGVADLLRLPGYRDDALACLAAMDLFCFPSREEGLGTSVLEALAMERPVVATRAGGIPEMIRDGEHGLLVPPGDPPALAAAMTRLLGDPELGRRLALAGRARVASEFSIERTVEETLAAYAGL
jgi:glycosyltransferase involved in cell wall biosynthesis